MVTLYDQHGRPIDLKSLPPRRQYAAAKTTRLTGNWRPTTQNINEIISASNPAVRSRVRQLVRDFPYFARAVNVLVDFTVGQGLAFQSRVKGQDGKLNKAVCQQIEDAFSFWCDEADISGRLHFLDIMRLAKRQDVEAGEFLIVKVSAKDRNRFLPYALQVYEADWLTSRNDTHTGASIGKGAAAGTQIWQGIEYDAQTGRIAAYHLDDPSGYSVKTQRIPAEDVIHGFETLRPGQLRGISPFASAILVAHDLSDFMDATIDRSKLAAKWLAFIETPDPVAFQSLRAVSATDGSQQMIEELENAIIEYLRPGEKVNFASPDGAGDSFTPFTRFILRMVAISVGISYELISGDYEGLNYTVLRGVRNDLITQFRPIIKRHERQFCWATFKPFLDWAAVTGRLSLPDYFSNPYRYLRAQWIPQGMPAVDPLKEGRADADAIASCTKSPQEVVAARGRDLEEVYDEIAAAKEMQKDRGIEPEGVSKSTKSNPASLDDDSGQKSAKLVAIRGVQHA